MGAAAVESGVLPAGLPVELLAFARNNVWEGKSSLFSESTYNLNADVVFWLSSHGGCEEAQTLSPVE